MKDLVRMRTSLTEEVENILNEQIKIEANSSAKYLGMASWCAEKGFEYSEKFFMNQSDEERGHMLKIFKYVNDMGGKAYSPEVALPRHDFSSLKEVFEAALEQEIGVSNAIHRIVDLCRKIKDYTTDNFMQWFIKEQLEEEFIARRQLQLFDIIGEQGAGLYMIDKKIASVKYEAEPSKEE